jgi:hypothetical protein
MGMQIFYVNCDDPNANFSLLVNESSSTSFRNMKRAENDIELSACSFSYCMEEDLDNLQLEPTDL